MKPPPKDWPRMSSAVFYDDPAAAIAWLERAFGFETRLKVEGEGGRIEHSELTFGEGLVMVAGAASYRAHEGMEHARSPKSLGGANTQALCVYVDDVEAHHAKAKAAGAKITRELKTTDYGADYWTDRSYECADPEGHRWFFSQRMR